MSADATVTGSFAATAVQRAALAVGVVFLLVGTSGFIPGITSGVEDLRFAGPSSEAFLFGVFQVSVLHNILLLLLGAGAALSVRTVNASRMFLLGGGLLFGVMWVYGIAASQNMAPNFVPFNTADTWLHLVLFVGLLALGVLPPKLPRRARVPVPPTTTV